MSANSEGDIVQCNVSSIAGATDTFEHNLGKASRVKAYLFLKIKIIIKIIIIIINL